MYKNLRILFTILSAICVAAVLPVGAFLDFTWAIVTALAAFLFYLIMIVCKHAQEAQEGTQGEHQPQATAEPPQEGHVTTLPTDSDDAQK